jgi:asparagine synthetase B (glutamine-hydrolysing)
MCGIIFTNKIIENINYINFFCKKRGPDHTSKYTTNNYTFIHNLLQITGKTIQQPFIDKKNDIVCIYNGEIYNYNKEKYESDGQCIIDFYKKYNNNFIQYLDGEFAICLVDFKKNIIIFSSDIFTTKPLFYSINNKYIGISSYYSSLDRLKFKDIKKMPANTTFIYDINNLELLEKKKVYTFDLKQYKTNLNDIFKKLEESIIKRCDNLKKKIFLGLSSGYDSGCINCILNKLNIEHTIYTIEGSENIDILKKRHDIHKFNKEYIINEKKNFDYYKNYIKKNCEYYNYIINGSIYKDPAASGLALICDKANKKKELIYISGQGPDEIISDYSINGKNCGPSNSTCFNGKFPNDLKKIFPWANFFGRMQTDYLMKEELVSGTFGIEGRYPYLDKEFVQEFLWLVPELKNKDYKYILAKYMENNNYPFVYEKQGFRANWGI